MMNMLSMLLLNTAASIGVIGGADGPTAIFVAANKTPLSASLTLAWQGMVGIFVVMIVIALIVYLLSKLTSGMKK